jgi:hypothetical protein
MVKKFHFLGAIIVQLSFLFLCDLVRAVEPELRAVLLMRSANALFHGQLNHGDLTDGRYVVAWGKSVKNDLNSYQPLYDDLYAFDCKKPIRVVHILRSINVSQDLSKPQWKKFVLTETGESFHPRNLKYKSLKELATEWSDLSLDLESKGMPFEPELLGTFACNGAGHLEDIQQIGEKLQNFGGVNDITELFCKFENGDSPISGILRFSEAKKFVQWKLEWSQKKTIGRDSIYYAGGKLDKKYSLSINRRTGDATLNVDAFNAKLNGSCDLLANRPAKF